MKTYLSGAELNDLLFVTHLIEFNRTTVNNWEKRGNLTKEEAKFLRTGATWTEKFLTTVLNRMPKKEVEKYAKRTLRAQQDPIRILDKWMQDRVFGTYETEFEVVKVERPQFEQLAMVAIHAHCRDCNKSYTECDLYDILEDNLVPRCETKCNCAYAYISEEAKQRAEEKKKLKAEKKNKVSKRKAKKIANRFDENQEEYVYNFTPKNKGLNK